MQTRPIFTRGGAEVWYAHPERTPIDEVDVVSHLSALVRYLGACPVTVLNHSLLCYTLGRAYGYGAGSLPYLLAHDLHEAYIGDVPGPLKQVLGEVWHKVENRWAEYVHSALGLDWPVPFPMSEHVAHVDRRAMVVESRVLGWSQAGWFADEFGGPLEDRERQALEAVLYGAVKWTDVRHVIPAFRDGRNPWG